MPQFPSWKLPTAAWTDAVGSRTSQVRLAFAELATRGKHATDDFTVRAGDLAGRTRDRCEAAPRAVVDELRRRINVLDLATKQDVETQNSVARNRVSHALKEFLEEQRGHEQHLLETLRSELHEELQSFAAAIDDDLFAIDDTPARVSKSSALDFLDEDDDDLDDNDIDGEIDLGEYEALDDELDIADDGTMIRRPLLDAADG
jgi:hypothetical protein